MDQIKPARNYTKLLLIVETIILIPLVIFLGLSIFTIFQQSSRIAVLETAAKNTDSENTKDDTISTDINTNVDNDQDDSENIIAEPNPLDTFTQESTYPALYSAADATFSTGTTALISNSKAEELIKTAKGEDLILLNCFVDAQFQATSNSDWSDFTHSNANGTSYVLSRPNSWRGAYSINAGFNDYSMTGCFQNLATYIFVYGAYTVDVKPTTGLITSDSGKYTLSTTPATSVQGIKSGGMTLGADGYSSVPSLEVILWDNVQNSGVKAEIKTFNLYKNADTTNIKLVMEDFVNLWSENL